GGGGDAEGAVEGGVVYGGDDVGRDGQTQGHQQGGARQLERRGHTLDDQAEGGLAVADRLAEVAVERADQEAAVLHDERIVEAHRLPELLHGLFGRGGRPQHRSRTAGGVE